MVPAVDHRRDQIGPTCGEVGELPTLYHGGYAIYPMYSTCSPRQLSVAISAHSRAIAPISFSFSFQSRFLLACAISLFASSILSMCLGSLFGKTPLCIKTIVLIVLIVQARFSCSRYSIARPGSRYAYHMGQLT